MIGENEDENKKLALKNNSTFNIQIMIGNIREEICEGLNNHDENKYVRVENITLFFAGKALSDY